MYRVFYYTSNSRDIYDAIFYTDLPKVSGKPCRIYDEKKKNDSCWGQWQEVIWRPCWVCDLCCALPCWVTYHQVILKLPIVNGLGLVSSSMAVLFHCHFEGSCPSQEQCGGHLLAFSSQTLRTRKEPEWGIFKRQLDGGVYWSLCLSEKGTFISWFYYKFSSVQELIERFYPPK